METHYPGVPSPSTSCSPAKPHLHSIGEGMSWLLLKLQITRSGFHHQHTPMCRKRPNQTGQAGPGVCGAQGETAMGRLMGTMHGTALPAPQQPSPCHQQTPKERSCVGSLWAAAETD